MKATIHIEDFELPCSIGVYEHEKKEYQNLQLTLALSLDISTAVKNDSIQDTIDYDQVISIFRQVSQKKHFNLLETLAYEITQALLDQLPRLTSVTVCLKKPNAIKMAKWSAITLERAR